MALMATKDELSMLKVYCESYNSIQKSLILIAVAADFELVDVVFPSGLSDVINTMYEQATIALIEATLGLMEVGEGETFEMFPSGGSVEIGEDYILTLVDTDCYVPASIIDPQALFPFKYRKIRLVYTFKDNLPSRFGSKPKTYIDGGEIDSPPYPELTIQAYPPFSLSLTNSKMYFAYDYYNGLPTGHTRIGIAPGWACLLAGYADSDPLEPWHSDVYDLFVPTSYGEPYWLDEWPFWLVSKGLNNSWVDTWEELQNRNFDFQGRMNHWIAIADPGYVGQEWRGSNFEQLWYYANAKFPQEVPTKPKSTLPPSEGGITGGGKLPEILILGESAGILAPLMGVWKRRKRK